MIAEDVEQTKDGLLRSIFDGDRERVMAACDRLEEQIRSETRRIRQQLIVTGILEELLTLSRKKAQAYGIPDLPDYEIMKEQEVTNLLDQCKTLHDLDAILQKLRNFFLEICGRFAATKKKRRHKDTSASRMKAADRVMACIHREYANPNLRMNDVSQQAFISNSYLTMLVKERTGKTFSEYLTDIRMDHAKELLLMTDWKTYEIAEACGFVNATYFSTVFKRKYGVSPTEFRTRGSKNTEKQNVRSTRLLADI